MNTPSRSLLLGALVSASLFGCGPGGPGEMTVDALTVSSDITSPTTWAATAADCDVVVTKEIAVKAKLTIAPGVKVCFEAKTGLLVRETGSLSAVGTDTARITLTGTSASPGFWKGVAFLSNDVANSLQYVDLSYAGHPEGFCCGFFNGSENSLAALVVGDYQTSALVALSHSRVMQSGAGGVYANENARLTGFADNEFSGNAGAPVALPLVAVNDLDAASVYSGGATPNGTNVVRVLAFRKTTTPVTLKRLDVPYAMSEGTPNKVFEVAAPMTIEAGTRAEFEANSGLLIAANGSLNVNGTAAARVTLTGRSPTPGYWKGVAVLSLSNALSNTDLSFAGNDDSFCCGFFNGQGDAKAGLVVGDTSTTGGVVVTDVAVTQSKNRGVFVVKGSLTEMGTNDLVTGNALPNIR